MRGIRLTCTAAAFLFLASAVDITWQKTVRHPNARGRREEEEDPFQRPWQINQGVCPPSLCNVPSNVENKPDSDSSNRILVDPFFEGDIVLSPNKRASAESSGGRATVMDDGWTRRNRVQHKYRHRQHRRYHRCRTMTIRKGRTRTKRAIVRPEVKLWQNKTVPYTIDDSLGDRAKKLIRSAHRHIERKTCIEFVKKTKRDKDYIRYVKEPGCWSYIGRQGHGAQKISIGTGCEYFGTIVHETGHALGFWHEQSRRDRDKFIKVIKENISPSALKNFGRLERSEVKSRGFAYDYQSIMHYGADYFSINAKPTIEVIGVGKFLKVKIGQRRALSDIDIAQLRDMYKCNVLPTTSKVCPKDWLQRKSNCYNFVLDPVHQFAAANSYCQKIGGRLLHIESRSEDMFIKEHIQNNYEEVNIWRIGGRRDRSKFVWSYVDEKSFKEMKYQSWAPGHPARFSAMGLVRDPRTSKFQWKGLWLGSINQLPMFAYPFICEMSLSKKKCFHSYARNGLDYTGKLDFSLQGITCQHWTSQWPHNHTSFTGNKDIDAANGLGDHNYCRNPGGIRTKPWCFTTKQNIIWQYCNVNLC